jgi:hypothetical protein
MASNPPPPAATPPTSNPKAGDSQAYTTPPGSTTDDFVRTIIALGVTIIGLVALVSFWVFRPVTDAQAFSTVVVGLMGTVLGYYFGANGKQASDIAAQTATAKATGATAQAQKAHIRVTEVRARLQAQKGTSSARIVGTGAPSPTETGVADEVIASLMQAERDLETT